MIDLTLAIAFYNAVVRLLGTLQIDVEPEYQQYLDEHPLPKELSGAKERVMMEGFTRSEIKTSGARIVTVHGGKGPPLLLMHGNPFTHLSWHKFAPRLAQEFTVVATDLRGYGDSEKPPGGDDHSGYSFRAMAQDQVEVMAALGFQALHGGRPRPRRARAAPHVPRPSRARSSARRSSTSCRSTICSTTSPRHGRPTSITGSS